MAVTLLHVHHTTSPSVHAMFDAVQSGATDPQIEGVDVVTRAALQASPPCAANRRPRAEATLTRRCSKPR